ncbi:MAG: UDP-N-acetyl-alpha-D-quinovosamine dehydrogenase [Betaproteobacteria bacterium]
MVQVAAASKAFVLVTGATGFVGSELCVSLANAGYQVRRALHAGSPAAPPDIVVGDINGKTAWRAALEHVDTVIHLAARTHAIRERTHDTLPAYRSINVDGTARLAEQAVKAGVRRLIFLSSIKVNGEETGRAPFRETDIPRPEDPYGITKLEAEQLLTRRASETGLELVIIRPPLVYGPGVKGNLLRLMRLLVRGVPLPLGSIDNRRSLVALANLTDAIVACVRTPHAAGRTYLVSDDEPLSTPALVRKLAESLQVKPRLFRCPLAILETAAALTGRSSEITRLTRSLEIDSSHIRNDLNWMPPYSLSQGFTEMGRWYNAQFCTPAIAE